MSGAGSYAAGAAATAAPGRLVVMLYDGFARFAAQAKAAYQEGDAGQGGLRLTRAQRIVGELHASLDMTQGPLAQRLAAIYDYVDDRLTQARLDRDVARIDEAARAMAELRSAWAQVATTPRPAGARPVAGVDLAG